MTSSNSNDYITIGGWTVPKHRIAAISPVFPFAVGKHEPTSSWNIKVFVDGMVEPIILSHSKSEYAEYKIIEILREITYVSG